MLLLIHISLFAALVPLLTRLPPRRLDHLLASGRAADTLDPNSARRIVRYVNLALAVGAPMIRPTCITRGLTLYYFLGRAGAEVALCFGIAAAGAKVAGHCWLMRDGEPFLEPQDPRGQFTEMYRLPLRSRASRAGRGAAE